WFGFSFSNRSAATTLQAVTITSTPAAGALTFTLSLHDALPILSAADIAAGKLSFAPVANANGSNYAHFTFQVQDDGGTANGGVKLDQNTNTLTIRVTPVSDAPAGTDNTVTVLEDGAHVFTAAEF